MTHSRHTRGTKSQLRIVRSFHDFHSITPGLRETHSSPNLYHRESRTSPNVPGRNYRDRRVRGSIDPPPSTFIPIKDATSGTPVKVSTSPTPQSLISAVAEHSQPRSTTNSQSFAHSSDYRTVAVDIQASSRRGTQSEQRTAHQLAAFPSVPLHAREPEASARNYEHFAIRTSQPKTSSHQGGVQGPTPVWIKESASHTLQEEREEFFRPQTYHESSSETENKFLKDRIQLLESQIQLLHKNSEFMEQLVQQLVRQFELLKNKLQQIHDLLEMGLLYEGTHLERQPMAKKRKVLPEQVASWDSYRDVLGNEHRPTEQIPNAETGGRQTGERTWSSESQPYSSEPHLFRSLSHIPMTIPLTLRNLNGKAHIAFAYRRAADINNPHDIVGRGNVLEGQIYPLRLDAHKWYEFWFQCGRFEYRQLAIFSKEQDWEISQFFNS